MDLGSMYSIFQGSNPFASLCARQNAQRPFAKTIVWQLTRSFSDFKGSFSNKKEFPWSNMCTPLKTNTDTQTSHVYTPFQSIHTFGSILIMFIFQGVHLSNLAINPLWIPTRVLQKSFLSPWWIDFGDAKKCLWTHRIPWGINKAPTTISSIDTVDGSDICLTIWDVSNPVKNDEVSKSTGAKFLPPTVATQKKMPKEKKTPTLSPKWTSVFLPQPKHLGAREKLHTEVR